MTQNQDFSTPTLPVYNRLQPYRTLTIILAVAVLAHVAIFVDLPLFWRSAVRTAADRVPARSALRRLAPRRRRPPAARVLGAQSVRAGRRLWHR